MPNVDIFSMHMSIFESDKKKKIDCRNPESKAFLLKQVKKKRPEGIYVSEFLTKIKLNIFYDLLQLRKQEKFSHCSQEEEIYFIACEALSGRFV